MRHCVGVSWLLQIVINFTIISNAPSRSSYRLIQTTHLNYLLPVRSSIGLRTLDLSGFLKCLGSWSCHYSWIVILFGLLLHHYCHVFNRIVSLRIIWSFRPHNTITLRIVFFQGWVCIHVLNLTLINLITRHLAHLIIFMELSRWLYTVMTKSVNIIVQSVLCWIVCHHLGVWKFFMGSKRWV